MLLILFQLCLFCEAIYIYSQGSKLKVILKVYTENFFSYHESFFSALTTPMPYP